MMATTSEPHSNPQTFTLHQDKYFAPWWVAKHTTELCIRRIFSKIGSEYLSSRQVHVLGSNSSRYVHVLSSNKSRHVHVLGSNSSRYVHVLSSNKSRLVHVLGSNSSRHVHVLGSNSSRSVVSYLTRLSSELCNVIRLISLGLLDPLKRVEVSTENLSVLFQADIIKICMGLSYINDLPRIHGHPVLMKITIKASS
ncbi:hypothetical protein AVEN_89991-1 [Araneus ventricosus]|uniref:Uncharacterized protein n=1 Tax=Araneus ventricosus TaxID=182803 RepID=A0A4Y2DCY4_ARAVE|nr:hypothetical protein AVEN_89991-1 [Araneus ventricosus]